MAGAVVGVAVAPKIVLPTEQETRRFWRLDSTMTRLPVGAPGQVLRNVGPFEWFWVDENEIAPWEQHIAPDSEWQRYPAKLDRRTVEVTGFYDAAPVFIPASDPIRIEVDGETIYRGMVTSRVLDLSKQTAVLMIQTA